MDFKDRPCWKCGKKNHLAKDCKEKLAGVNEEKRIGSLHSGAPLRSLSALNDGFSTPKKTIRPMPQNATLDEFVSTTNRFSSLSQRERKMAPPLKSDGFTVRSDAEPEQRCAAEGRRGTAPTTTSRLRKAPSSAETRMGTSDEIKNNQRKILDNQQKIRDKCCELADRRGASAQKSVPADRRCDGGSKRLNLLKRSGNGGEILGLPRQRLLSSWPPTLAP